MKPKTQSGFTLLEVLATVAIAMILAVAGIPMMTEFVRSARVTTSTNDFIAASLLARSEAIKRRSPVTLCVSANSQAAAPSCSDDSTWNVGWVVFADDDGDAAIDGGEEILQRQPPLDDSITMTASASFADYVSFNSAGLTRDTAGASVIGSLVVCDERGINDKGDGASAARGLSVSRTGRAQSLKSQAEITALGVDCP